MASRGLRLLMVEAKFDKGVPVEMAKKQQKIEIKNN